MSAFRSIDDLLGGKTSEQLARDVASRRVERMAQHDHPGAPTSEGWERFFWLVFNRSAIPMGILDENRCRVAVNQAMCRYVGRSRTELIGRKLDLDIARSTLDRLTAAWNQVLRAGEGAGTVDLVRSDGVELHSDFASRMTVIDERKLVLSVMLAGEPKFAGVSQLPGQLSPRERTVVHLLTLGLTSPEIAQRLSISVPTVRTHVRNAMAKTGTRTRAQLVAVALATGLTHESDT